MFRSVTLLAVASAMALAACGPSQPQVVYQAPPQQPQVVVEQQQPQYVPQPQIQYVPQPVFVQPTYNNGYMDVVAGAVLSAAVISALRPDQYTYRNGQYYSTTVIHNHVDRSTYDRIAAKNATINAQRDTINAQRQAAVAKENQHRQELAAQQQKHDAAMAQQKAQMQASQDRMKQQMAQQQQVQQQRAQQRQQAAQPSTSGGFNAMSRSAQPTRSAAPAAAPARSWNKKR